MPWMEIEINPQSDWNEEGLEDWTLALGAFLTEKGTELKPEIRRLPGFNIVHMGEEGAGALTLHNAERLVLIDGIELKGASDFDFARFVIRFAGQMGAVGVCASINSSAERHFWEQIGGILRPDPVSLEGKIIRDKVSIQQLIKFFLLVTYEEEPVLCLEPITVNCHAPGIISLAQRRLEKMYGGNPLGFASWRAVHCPWTITQDQWQDLLAYSRLQAFDLLEELVLNSL
ncbi:hypothetical protein Desaci_3779 [Desulfosporosinus acidiphilus SJ4]|uniref:Uncharacterized protein n=1 Tax=Desulfosporosinus acidiphilus (strain DSM 22704 / JCM 16185 / SJ4) TaxID=646529 RepID=I4DA36_DESAJ|nr:hypothetical protein [Desulfosporosinus acidiphilus]AFM42660.1 hypothetical protein Desaci_3779 [Desulfosporosinus acidiphilus SJ4]